MAEVGTFYQSKYTGEQLDEILKNVYDAVPLDGSKPVTGALDIKKVENGYSRFNKNHTQTTDLGTELKDISKGGSVVALLLKAADQAARLQFGTSVYDLIHTGNITGYVKPYADAAQAASEAAESALEGVREAIEAIPEGAATPIVNDLTTGGTSMALSAEMGKKLNTEQNKLLPLDGSKAMTGGLTVTKAKQPAVVLENTTAVRNAWYALQETDNSLVLANRANDQNRNNLIISPETATLANLLRLYRVVEGSGKVYNILHTGNKPSGSYTGNGSAASRTIDTGGIGNVCVVFGYGGFAIVTMHGGIIRTAAGVIGLSQSEAAFANGVLTLATTNDVLNRNGSTADYQVL